MLSLLGWIFIVLLWGVSAFFAFLVFSTVVSVLALCIRFTFESLGLLWRGLFQFKTMAEPKPTITEPVQLEDPIGVLSLISHRYETPLSLKDLAFLEVELFGTTSKEVADWFRAAEGDPRPEVCGAFASRILLKLAADRKRHLLNNSWTDAREKKWTSGTPREFRILIAS